MLEVFFDESFHNTMCVPVPANAFAILSPDPPSASPAAEKPDEEEEEEGHSSAMQKVILLQ